jgi:plastocyanin
MLLVFVVGCTGNVATSRAPSTVPEKTPVSAVNAIVTIEDNAFFPPSVIIGAGETVRWMNDDAVVHTVTGFGIDERIGPGQTFDHTFAEAGTYPYVCSIHAGMQGEVVVQ